MGDQDGTPELDLSFFQRLAAKTDA